VFRRLFRVTFKLALIAAIGFGIAVVVKKLTAPADTPVPLEPWPPLPTDPSTASAPAGAAETTEASAAPDSTNGETAPGADESKETTS
jgi:hypothetical protein